MGARRLIPGRAERSALGPGDPLAPHGLAPDALARLGRTLERFPTIHEAWLVRKVLRHFPEDPLFILAVRAGAVWALNDAQKAQELVQQLLPELQLPGGVVVVDLFTQGALAECVRGSAGSAVYRGAG